jgi:hypothetical protein
LYQNSFSCFLIQFKNPTNLFVPYKVRESSEISSKKWFLNTAIGYRASNNAHLLIASANF